MKRHIFVSDIHGDYNKLAKALAGAKFDPNQDTLVCLGDIFDRGSQSLEVLQFLMGLPHKILIWGNHDYRLRELIIGEPVGQHDYQNGVRETLHSLCPNHKSIQSIDILLNIFSTDVQYADTYKLLWQYFDTCIWAAEWDDLIATHAWLPHVRRCVNMPTAIQVDWRNATRQDWYAASWAHTEQCIEDQVYPDKSMIIGHWHTWRLWRKFAKMNTKDIPWDTYVHYIGEDKMIICIDGCTNATDGIVNAYILYLDENYQSY